MKRDYNCPAYKKARAESLKRDNRQCQMPDCKSKKRLQSHHIRPWSQAPSLRFDKNNLITLCRSCHESVTKKESFYVGLFMDIVRRNENNSRH